MNTLIGLLVIAVGSFGQSSSYVPISRLRIGRGKVFWLVQGGVCLADFSLFGSFFASVPQRSTLGALLSVDPAASWKAIGFGILWGVGGLTFGLSMRYAWALPWDNP